MTDDGLEDPACPDSAAPADSREKEHQRRNRLQAELLRKAYDRSRHASFIDAALRRARGDQETDEANHRAEGC
jgi:hypothetical protein